MIRICQNIIYWAFVFITTSCNNGENEQLDHSSEDYVLSPQNKEERFELLEKNLNADTVFLSKGALLYRNFDRDSVWLTLITEEKEEVQLEVWTDMLELSSRMGLHFLQEYETKLLFERNVISGCCSFPDNLIYDKISGDEIENVGSRIWYSPFKRYPLLICFDNSSSENVSSECHSLRIFNLDNNKEFLFSLADYDFFENFNDAHLSDDLGRVEDSHLEDSILNLTIRKRDYEKEGIFTRQLLKLNLNDY